MHRSILIACVIIAACITLARGDEILFKNGDRMSGKVQSIDGGKMKFKSDVAGEVTIEMEKVQTFSTDEPVQTRLQDKRIVRDKIAAGQEVPDAPATQPTPDVVVGGKEVAVSDIKAIIPPSAWTGSIVANGYIARGNSHQENYGLAADASLRRDDEVHDDRFTLGAAYNFGKQTVDGVQTTSADNWFALGKYDRFFTEKWYGYGIFRVDRDRLADLNYRLSPGVGAGYQWVESADFNFSTEAGLSYIYEDYRTGGSDERVAVRLAYKVDKKLNDKVSVFHNLEWLPAIDDPSNFNLNADAGLRAMLTESWFSEAKVQWLHDSEPAPGAESNDLRFLLGIGWSF